MCLLPLNSYLQEAFLRSVLRNLVWSLCTCNWLTRLCVSGDDFSRARLNRSVYLLSVHKTPMKSRAQRASWRTEWRYEWSCSSAWTWRENSHPGKVTLCQKITLKGHLAHLAPRYLLHILPENFPSCLRKMKKQRYIICLLVLTSLSNFLCFLMMISKDWKPNEIWRCLSTVWLKAEAGVGLRLFFEWAWSVGVGWIDSSVLQFLFLNLSFSLSYAQIRDLCRGKIKFTYKSITMTPRGRHTTLYCN